jgi:hypothetical protein
MSAVGHGVEQAQRHEHHGADQEQGPCPPDAVARSRDVNLAGPERHSVAHSN